MKGIELALEEVNSEGLYNNRKLRIIFRDNKADPKRNWEIAHEFARNTDLTIVFGHYNSTLALPSSVTYQEYGVLFLTPGSLLYDLGLHGFSMFFRSIPNSLQIGQQCARYTYKLGYNKPVVVWVRNQYGKNLYYVYKSYLGNLGIQIENSFSLFSWQTDYREIVAKLKNLEFDMIFVAFGLPDAAYFIREARRGGIDQPVLGVNFFSEGIIENAGEYATNIYTVSNFNPDSENPYTQEFVSKFKEKFGNEPDVWAAYAYDGIMLIAHMINVSETAHPEILASNLRYMDEWPGATGMHSFSPRGEITSKSLYLEQFKNGEFHVIDVDTVSRVDLYTTLNFLLREYLERGYVGLYDAEDGVNVLLPDYSVFTGLNKYRISAIGDTILRIISGEVQERGNIRVDVEGFAEQVFVADGNGMASADSLLNLTLFKSSQVAKYLYQIGLNKSQVEVRGRGYSKSMSPDNVYSTRKAFDNRIELRIPMIIEKEEEGLDSLRAPK